MGKALVLKVRQKRKGSDYMRVSWMFMRILLIAAASFFVCILTGAQRMEPCVKLRISLQSDKNGEGSYLFLPSFVKLSNVEVQVPGQQTTGGILSEENDSGTVTVQTETGEREAQVCRSGNVPSLFLETEELLEKLEADKANVSAGRFTLYLPDGRMTERGEIAAVHGHGNSTWYENKKSWLMELAGRKSLLGMSSAKKWLLISNAKDASMMRNKLFMDMSKGCSLPGALSCEWVDLYINGEYQGLYLLSEKVDIAAGRLEIGNLEQENKDLNGDVTSYMNYTIPGEETLLQGWFLPENPKNITGGYLLEMDYPVRYAAEPSKFITRNGQHVVVKNPAYASVEQIQYIYGFVQDFESALYAEDGCIAQGEELDPDRAGMYYTEVLDIDSFAKRYVLDEISKNIDANSSSVFFYKPRYEDRLYAGPVWDYDLALGNSGDWGDAGNLHDPEGYYVNLSGWNKALYEKPEFYAAVEQCYQEDYAPWLEELLSGGFDEYKEQIRQAAGMDNLYRGVDNWEEDADEMRIFLEKRKKWLDEQWGR